MFGVHYPFSAEIKKEKIQPNMEDPSARRKHVSQEFSSNPTSWAAPPHNMASLTNPCVNFSVCVCVCLRGRVHVCLN